MVQGAGMNEEKTPQGESNVSHAIWSMMVFVNQMLKNAKPAERSELARRYAVTLTEYEKVMAYYLMYVVNEMNTDEIPTGTTMAEKKSE